MKLFDGFEVVRFPEENLFFVTHDGYIYYVFNPQYKHWRKHRNAGNDHITVSNYQEVSEEEIKQYNSNRPKEDDTETELIIDFYRRFTYRMEYMMKVGGEKGYDLISFMGP